MTSHPRHAPATRRRPILVIAAALAILAAACGQGATPLPSASAPPPSPEASIPASVAAVTSPEVAAALVLASDSRFTGIKPKNPDLIGGCCFYEVTPKGDDYTVMIEIGWGDCPAGCINRHHWFYTVTNDGTVTFDKEDGPAVPTGVPGTAIGDGGTAGGGSDTGGFDTSGGSEQEADGIRGTVTAGPTCAVATIDDPNCADRPVSGAIIHVIDVTGVEVARLTTDEAGTFQVALAPGPYQLRADPVESAMSAPPPTDIVVEAGMAVVELSYDTGIR